MTLDIKDFYYGTAMARYEYMKLALACIPYEIIEQYSLCTISSDGWVYLKIHKVMPGLKQAGRIVNNRLKAHLSQFGFPPVPRTPALWKILLCYAYCHIVVTLNFASSFDSV